MKKVIINLVVVISSFLLVMPVHAQCSVCRASVESNHTHSEDSQKVARQLNDGILYLMSVPYLVLAGIAYMFYKNRNTDENV